MEYPDVLTSLETEKVLTDDIRTRIEAGIKDCLQLFSS